MKHLLIVWGIFLPALAMGQLVKVPPRKVVPPQVLRSAQVATQALADRVVRGDLAVTVEKMYPAWKKKEARKAGGVKKLETQILKAFKKLQGEGVRVVAMKAKQPYSAFEVNFGLEERIVNGKKTKVGVYREWLVFVPTEKIVTAVNPATNPPEMVDVLKQGYQVAICKKGTNDWTFMDGNQVGAFQLRKLFPYLPSQDKELGLPKSGGRIIKKR